VVGGAQVGGSQTGDRDKMGDFGSIAQLCLSLPHGSLIAYILKYFFLIRN
jgi:hypothetical protein